jgi:ribosome-associated heat shock protein Hsp15
MSLRWDKFIWSVRLAKTRSQASEAISKGKIKINGAQIKPSKEPKIGDLILISHNSAVFSYKVLNLLDKRVGPKLVVDYLIETTTDEEREKFRLYKLAQSAYRDNGTGKPTKKDRRELDDFLENWEDDLED